MKQSGDAKRSGDAHSAPEQEPWTAAPCCTAFRTAAATIMPPRAGSTEARHLPTVPEQNGPPDSPASPLSEPPSARILEELPDSPFSQSREARASSVGDHSQSSTPASITPPPPHLSIRHTHTRHAALLEGEGA